MKIKITALDTLFFRDGKPFDMGDDTWATGQFPPLPSVFYGALRSLYFSVFQDEFAKINTEDRTENLEINEITLWQKEPLYVCAGDIVEVKEQEDLKLLYLESNNSNSSYPLACLLTTKEQVENLLDKALLGESQFKDEYLKGGLPQSVTKLDKLLISESKVGIGRDNITRTSEDGKLFRVGMNRLMNKEGESLGFYIDFEGLDFKGELPPNGFIKLGAENKVAAYEVLDDTSFFERDPIEIDSYFKLVLTTPGIFQNGWYPDFLDKNQKGIFQNAEVKMIGACTGKFLSVGGFDMRKRQPKPMYKALPAGSTFFFKIVNDTSLVVNAKPLKLNCIGSLEKQGFGVAYISDLKAQKNQLI